MPRFSCYGKVNAHLLKKSSRKGDCRQLARMCVVRFYKAFRLPVPFDPTCS